MCDCCGSTDHLFKSYARLAASDLLVAKALRMEEVTQIARAEIRLRKLVLANWNRHASKAAVIASKMAIQLKPASAIAAAVRKEMANWAKEITPTFNAEIARVYRLARTAGHKKSNRLTTAPLQFNTPNLTAELEGGRPINPDKVPKHLQKPILKAKAEVLPDFDLVDSSAVKSLEEHNTFWIGNHYDQNISNSIRDTAKETMVQAGQNAKVAGKEMAKRIKNMLGSVVTPTGFHGSAAQYFEGLVANAMTVGRVYGQMRSFAEAGIRTYTISNPGGSRICEVCAHLQGKTFKTEQGLRQIESELQLDNPADIKSAHPWVGMKQLKEISYTPGRMEGVYGEVDSNRLSDAGLSLPPYHMRCRCTVDISDDVKSFSQLKPMSFPARVDKMPKKIPGAPKVLPAALPKTLANLSAKNMSAKDWTMDKELAKLANPVTGKSKTKPLANISHKLKNNKEFEKFWKKKGYANHEDAVENLLELWTHTSAQGSELATALQYAAQEEFGLINPALSHLESIRMPDKYKDVAGGLREFLRAQYNNTQEALKSAGITEVPIMRGMRFSNYDLPDAIPAKTFNNTTKVMEVSTQPISSWTTNSSVAVDFADSAMLGEDYGMVIAAKAPSERILGFASTGYGDAAEWEVVVLGGKDEVAAFSFNRSAGGFPENYFKEVENYKEQNAEILHKLFGKKK